jgi:hypothetical protein
LSQQPIDRLSLFDPKLARSLEKKQDQLNVSQLHMIVDITLWSFTIEIQLGYSVFNGLEEIVTARANDLIAIFIDHVKKYANKGTSLGILMADIFPVILLQRQSELTTQFLFTLNTLHDIGLYILHRPLYSFKKVLKTGDLNAARAMLELFTESFSKQLDFHQSKKLTQFLPKICESLSPQKRAFQIRQLIRVSQMNVEWIYACETGFQRGLQSLSSHALESFIQTGIDKFQFMPEKGTLYFSLSSEMARNVFESLQTVYPLRYIHDKLTQYLHARIGDCVRIRSISQLPKQFLQSTDPSFIYNDRLCIYLPDEIGLFSNKNDNRNVYKYLVRWEASLFEWGTYDFDLEKLKDMYQEIDLPDMPQQGSDLYRFLNSFSNITLAKHLFILFEHVRIRFCLKRFYPGILRVGLPIFQSMIQNDICQKQSILQQIYHASMFGMKSDESAGILYEQVMLAIQSLDHYSASVETSAFLICKFYAAFLTESTNDDIKTPFNNDICLELIEHTIEKFDQKAMKLCHALRQQKMKLYKSEIRKQLYSKNELTVNDIQSLIACAGDSDLINQCLMSLKGNENTENIITDKQQESGSVFHYNEWDPDICSYKINHTRVIQSEYPHATNASYEKTLHAHSGLLRHIRRRFEMIRPEGLKILRRWQEGDAFDYRQLLDYGIDRKMRKTPSDRIYTKRVKEYRDVAIFLLVDLSRSTANVLPQSTRTVLDVEQDAIIIFCEALKQCGDSFAVAGFSSAGRHAVSFYWFKQMDEQLSDLVKYRIGNMAAFRSTRMGAAIRHVSYLFEKCSSKIRLVIVLSDGFPNDSDYKQNYAIKDTRKAIHEAHSKGIFVHGITVNLSMHTQLDELYGKGNHHVITDVSELPDRLPIIYHQLTKSY